MKIVHLADIHWRGLARHDEYTNSFTLLFDKLKEIKPDVIVNCGDSFHTKTQSISPEIVERMTWMFDRISTLAGKNITILGNHDGNLTNLSRKDIISTILEKQIYEESAAAMGGPYTYFSRNSVTHDIWSKSLKDSVKFHCFSPFDKDGWKNMVPDPSKINIALFHGSVSGCVMDNGMVWPHGEIDVSDMNIFDFVLLGDIHQQQFMDRRKDKTGAFKPYMGYPGSLIQQNFGESIKKGFYVWDIRAKDDWDVEFHELDNLQPFYTFSWVNNVKETIENVIDCVPDGKILPGSRFRFVTREVLPQSHTETLVNILKTNYGAHEVCFKHEKDARLDMIDHERIKASKKNLRNDPDSVVSLFNDFMASQNQIFLSNEQKEKAHEQIKTYIEQYNNMPNVEAAIATGNQQWTVKWLEFGNLFRYGDNNKIDFEKQTGLIGLFGKNKIGKSSVIAATMYALFNTTDRGSIKASDIINKRKNSCWAKICFNHDGIDYVIERETTRTNQKDPTKSATKVNFFELKQKSNGSIVKVERNGISRDETDKEIRKLIGTPEDFLMTSLASQGDIMRFINEGSTNRKKILNRFLDIDLFEKLYALVKNDVITLNAKTKGFTVEDLNAQEIIAKKELERIEYQIANTNQLKTKKQSVVEELRSSIMLFEHKNKDRFLIENSIKSKKAMAFSVESHCDSLKNEILVKKKDISIKERLLSNLKQEILVVDIDNLRSMNERYEAVKSKTRELTSEINSENKVQASLEKSVKKLDLVPCGTEYPECFFIKDSHEDKEKLKEQNALLTKLLAEQEELTEQLGILAKHNISQLIADYDSACNRLKKQENELTNLKTELVAKESEHVFRSNYLKEIEQEIREMNTNLKLSAVSDTDGSSEKISEYNKNKEALDTASREIKAFETTLMDLHRSLGSCQNTIETIEKNKQTLQELHENFVVYSSIQEAFSKTGIPAMILKTQLPTINEELERILMGVTDFKIVLENDVASNAMDVYLEDSHSRRIVELGSGMEKTIASLAIRVALINISSIPRSDIFIVDEGFTALDEENMQSCLEMLNMLRSYFKSVLIISHEPAIKEVADRILEVKNDGIESKIEA